MNILKINGFNLDTNKYNLNLNNNNLFHAKFGLKMDNTLKADIVSFRGTPKAGKGMTNISHGVAKNIFESVDIMRDIIDTSLKKRFGKFLVTNENPNNILTMIKVRTKQPPSIRYKAGTRELYNTKEIYDTLTDLVAGKLVLNAATKQETGKVLQEWANAIKDGEFELVELEVKRPAKVKKDKLKGVDATKWDYAYPSMIDKVISSANKYQDLKVNQLPPDYTEVNYPAIHLLVKFPQKFIDRLVKEEGIPREIAERAFEIQILGHDVNIYKGLDDLFYKIFNDKGVDKMYDPFVKEASKLKDPGNAVWLDKFNAYRADTFIFQREREPISNTVVPTKSKKKEPYRFPIPRYSFPGQWDMDSWMALKLKCEADDAAKKAAEKAKKS